jgi:predicted aspartyl protease
MRLTPLLAAALLVAGCVSTLPPPPPAPIPAQVALHRQPDGRILVDAVIDGHGPYPFVLDTGSSVTVLDLALVVELGLASQGYDVTVHGVVSQSSAPAFESVSVGLGDDAIAPPWVVGLDIAGLSGARGVIGIDVLSQRVIEIDHGRGVVRFGRHAYDPPTNRDYSRANLVIDSFGLPHVLVHINNRQGLALLDTGLSGMIIDPTFAARARVPVSTRPADLVDVLSESIPAPRTGRARLQIGKARWVIERVALLRPAVLDRLDAGAPVVAVLGATVFEDTMLVFDFMSGALYIVERAG